MTEDQKYWLVVSWLFTLMFILWSIKIFDWVEGNFKKRMWFAVIFTTIVLIAVITSGEESV